MILPTCNRNLKHILASTGSVVGASLFAFYSIRYRKAIKKNERGIIMKDFTEKELRGILRTYGLSSAALLCVCLSQISASRHGVSSDFVLYLAVGSLLCSIILFIYYLTKYRKLKNN